MAAENTLRYIALDYRSHKEAILQRIRSRWPGVWNDFFLGSIGIVIVDVIAWSTATLAFVINRVAQENYLPTMTLRESAVRLGALVGYKLRGPASATVACVASIPAPLTLDAKIPARTVVRASNGLVYEVDQDYFIRAGETTPIARIVTLSVDSIGVDHLVTTASATNNSIFIDVTDSSIDLNDYIEAGQSFRALAINGQAATGTDASLYTITAIETAPGAVEPNRIVLDQPWTGPTGTGNLTSSEIVDTRIRVVQGQTVDDAFVTPGTEIPNFTIRLTRTGIVDKSITVTVNGNLWSEAASLAFYGGSEPVYEIRPIASGEIMLVFGDGKTGAPLPTNATVSIVYRIGAGSRGNIAVGAISGGIIGVIPVTNTPVSINLLSTSAGIGGQDEESLDQARTAIPAFVQANDRAVTLSDYEALARGFTSALYGRVKFARAGIRTGNALLEGNVVILYAWTEGASGQLVPVDGALRTALQTYLQTKAVATDYVLIGVGDSRPVPVSVRFKAFAGFNVEDVDATIRSTIKTIIEGTKPGDPVIFSDLMRRLDSARGVDNVDIATPIDDLFPSNSEEIFTPPDDKVVYATTLESASGFRYTSRLKISPLAVWSISLFLDEDELLILPDTEAGFARLVGTRLADYQFGLLADRPAPSPLNAGVYYFATDDDVSGRLYKSTGTGWQIQAQTAAGKSRLNLRTGEVDITLRDGASPATVLRTFLKTAQGYSIDRTVNVYIGYTGTDLSQAKRREIRTSLRAWSAQQTIGGTIFRRELPGVAASKSNVTDVVRAIEGVTRVNRVSLEVPSSSSDRVDATDLELLRLGDISINNQID